jgi:hypothetical protein
MTSIGPKHPPVRLVLNPTGNFAERFLSGMDGDANSAARRGMFRFTTSSFVVIPEKILKTT